MALNSQEGPKSYFAMNACCSSGKGNNPAGDSEILKAAIPTTARLFLPSNRRWGCLPAFKGPGWSCSVPQSWDYPGKSWRGRATHRAMGLILLVQWAYRAEYRYKEDYPQAINSHGICLARIWTCLIYSTPSSLNGRVRLVPVHHCILEGHNLSGFIAKVIWVCSLMSHR